MNKNISTNKFNYRGYTVYIFPKSKVNGFQKENHFLENTKIPGAFHRGWISIYTRIQGKWIAYIYSKKRDYFINPFGETKKTIFYFDDSQRRSFHDFGYESDDSVLFVAGQSPARVRKRIKKVIDFSFSDYKEKEDSAVRRFKLRSSVRHGD